MVSINSLPAWLVLTLLLSTPPAPAEDAPRETLCILDFNRQGDDDSMDWLQRGLADMLITSMNRLGQYQVIQRQQLRELLREHRLSAEDPAIRHARLARADFLMLGNFALVAGELVIELRLLRVDDQDVLAQGSWRGDPTRVLEAPATLSEDILTAQNFSVDEAVLVGLARAFPRTVDGAAAYYSAEQAAEVGNHTRALAHYLDAAQSASDFLASHRGVIRMYRMLKLNQHALEYAARLGHDLEDAGDLQHALEFQYFVAETLVETFERPAAAIRWLEKIVQLARHHDAEVPAGEGTTARVKRQALELAKTPKYAGQKGLGILGDPEIRFRIWYTDLDRQLARREHLHAGGGIWRRKGSRWIQEEVPDPTVFMWKIRALHQLAALHRQAERFEDTLASYRQILDDYRDLAQLPIFQPGENFYWSQGVRSHLKQALLSQQKQTGTFPRDPKNLASARIHLLKDRILWRRDFAELASDPRAAERFDQVEVFSFLAPAGLEIDSVEFKTKVNRLAGFHFGSLKREHSRKFLLEKGEHRREIELPPGTEFLSLRSSWGGILLLNNPQFSPLRVPFASGAPDVAWWEASFRLSPRSGTGAPDVGSKLADDEQKKARARDAKRVARHMQREGWERGSVDRTRSAADYLRRAALDGRALDWRVTTIDGDIQIVRRDDSGVSLPVPRPIRSEESERDPALVKSHEGGFALFWSRGPKQRPDRFYVASSRDLVDWSEPRELILGDDDDDRQKGGTKHSRAQTAAVFTTRTAYSMVLGGGLVRYSDDLIHWSEPLTVLPADSRNIRFLQTLDRRVWAVAYTASENEELYTFRDASLGYYVRGGKKYKKIFDVLVTSSADGRTWTPPTKILTHGEPSKLWAFALTSKQIAVAVLYNGRFLRWAVSTGRDRFETVNTPVRQLWRRNARFFVEHENVVCLRDVNGSHGQTMTVVLKSKGLYETLTKPLR